MVKFTSQRGSFVRTRNFFQGYAKRYGQSVRVLWETITSLARAFATRVGPLACSEAMPLGCEKGVPAKGLARWILIMAPTQAALEPEGRRSPAFPAKNSFSVHVGIQHARRRRSSHPETMLRLRSDRDRGAE